MVSDERKVGVIVEWVLVYPVLECADDIARQAHLLAHSSGVAVLILVAVVVVDQHREPTAMSGQTREDDEKVKRAAKD